MRSEARLILPVPTAKQVLVSRWLADRLCSLFGGYTATAGRGGWRDDEQGVTMHEPVICYDVAYDGADRGKSEELLALAKEMGQRAEQRCVYLRLPDGEVRMLDTREVDHADGATAPEATRMVA